MVKVKTFQGAVAKSDIASELASRPYDVITRQQAKKLANDNKHSYYHVIRPEIDLPEQIDEYDPSVYELGKKNLYSFLDEGYLTLDQESRFYVYQTEFRGKISTGIFLLIAIKDYERKIIKKHELTRQDKEQDRTKLIDSQNANAEPILISYQEVDTIEDIIHQITQQPPTISAFAPDDESKHKIWTLSTEVSHYIQTQFADQVDSLYIADGHHRMAASYNVAVQRRQQLESQGVQLTGEEPFEYVFAFAVSTRCLKICGYHRVIKSLNEVSPKHILKQISTYFDIQHLSNTDLLEPQNKGDYSMLIDGQWFKIKVKQDILQEFLGNDPLPQQKLDVCILQDLCITPIFGIKEIRTDKNIDFIGGDNIIPDLERKVFQEGYAVAIACFPVHISELIEIADKSQIMMPKSTWIVPKPRSGLVVRFF